MTPRACTPAFLLLSALLATGCASSGDSATFTPRGDPHVLTEAQIAAVGAGNLYEVVERLRPRWIQARGQQSMRGATVIGVYRGQTYMGGIEALRSEQPGSVSRIRWLDGSTATASLRAPGPGVHLAGAIVLES
jgi:predicted phosphoribosyltransferase